MMELTVAAADAYMATNINSSLIQSVQSSTALATCLGVSLSIVCMRAMMMLYFQVALVLSMSSVCIVSTCCNHSTSDINAFQLIVRWVLTRDF